MTQRLASSSAVSLSRSRTHLVRRSLLGGLVALGALTGTMMAGQARADLTPAFQAKLTVDTEYATGVSGATDIAFAADGRALITLKSGNVSLRTLDGLKTTISGKFGNVDTGSEKGLLGIVADPNVADTFYFYVSNGPSNSDKHHVYKGTLSGAGELTVDLANPIVGGSVQGGPGLEGPQNHDGGGLAIYNGKLYVSVGDTGANASPPQNKYGSCLNKPNGKILRVNLDGSIPTDNPLFNETMVTSCPNPTGSFGTAAPDKRIFAWGMRNPWRFWIDPKTGLMWIGDVGEGTREEISVGGGNQHYGYPFIEGNYDWTQNGQNFGVSCNTITPGRPCTAPVYDYVHAGNTPNDQQNPNRASVTGGLIPEGCGWSNVFDGKANYVFADYNAGWMRALEVNAARDGVTNAANPTAFGTFNSGPVSFRMGPEDSLYVVFVNVGAVYKFTPKDRTGPDCGAPMPGSGGSGGVLNGSGGVPSASGGSGNPAPTSGGAKAASGGAKASGVGGASSAAGGGAPKGEGGSVKDGCGCRVGGVRGNALIALGAVLSLLGAFGLRRRQGKVH
ncbi:MAG: PQQ-dependent sugar dehydrogenase [Polyangiaceae bacterium]|nr:PQQ-dependent sugar dehydrogenase [Polyangiaceae bacterium]